MESQINQPVIVVIFFLAAIGLYLLLSARIEKQFLTGEERTKIKEGSHNYFGLLIIFVSLGSSIFKEVFGFGNSFINTARSAFWLILFLFAFGYQFTKMSKISLPDEFVEKWRKLNFAFAFGVLLFVAANLIWNFVRWQNDGYKIFPTE
jgi:hypothetical protein